LSTSLQMVALAFLGVLLRRSWTRSYIKGELGLQHEFISNREILNHQYGVKYYDNKQWVIRIFEMGCKVNKL